MMESSHPPPPRGAFMIDTIQLYSCINEYVRKDSVCVAQGLSGFRVPNRYHERPVVTPPDPVRSMNHVIGQGALCASGDLRWA